MTAEIELMPLTREQLSHLRKAESVGFYTSPTRAYIKTSRSEKRDQPGEISHDINTASDIRGTRDEGGRVALAQSCYCSYRMHTDCGERGTYWRTITSFLKPGDVLTLSWGRDYETNGNMEKHELHGDRLTVLIDRSGKKYAFIIGVTVCPRNTARMIRRGMNDNE